MNDTAQTVDHVERMNFAGLDKRQACEKSTLPTPLRASIPRVTQRDPQALRQRAALTVGALASMALALVLLSGLGGGGGVAAALVGALAFATVACTSVYERARAAAAKGQQQAHLAQALADGQATETFLRLVADSLPARLSYWDRDNRCRFANRGFCEWHGITPDLILGRCVADLGPPWDRRAKANEPRVHAVLAGQTQRFERDDTAPDGTPCSSLAHYVPDWRGDEVVGFVVLATDLSTEKARERQLASALERAEAATRAKSAFLANMNHEIRTPLNAILGLVQLLRRNVPDSTSAQRLASVEAASRHLMALIDDLLDLSRIEAGSLAVEPEDVDLAALLGRVHALLAERAASKGLAFTLATGPLPPRLRTDPTRLMQALLNLASNAIKFTEHGDVTLTTQVLDESPEGWRVRFDVADTGPGIPAERVDRLFEPFEQGDASTTRRHGGSGLGLTITQQVVGLLGGTLVLGNRPGAGTLARIELPMQRPQALEMEVDVGDAEGALQSRHTGRRVLLVEDNEVNQIVAGELLRRVGLVVAVASDGAEALAEATRELPALMLMDVHMPVMDGLAATRQWRAHEASEGLPRLPVIALSASAFDDERNACLAAGMDDHIAKPIDAPQLYVTLLRWLDAAPPAPVQARSATQP